MGKLINKGERETRMDSLSPHDRRCSRFVGPVIQPKGPKEQGNQLPITVQFCAAVICKTNRKRMLRYSVTSDRSHIVELM